MSEVLKISEQKHSSSVTPQPSLVQDRGDINRMAEELRLSEREMDHTSNYFSLFDMFHHFSNSDESHEDVNYETLDGDYLLKFTEIPIQYGLEKSHLEENVYMQSARFQDDIIFTLNNSKLFELGAFALASGVASSLAILPDGFNISVALLLSAPLLVCICGLFVKYYGKKT